VKSLGTTKITADVNSWQRLLKKVLFTPGNTRRFAKNFMAVIQALSPVINLSFSPKITTKWAIGR
jgi:hypothetical protein